MTESDHINHCKELIEEKFKLESSDGVLRQRDLEYLAKEIEEQSGIRLSLSTLKRLWKKDYAQIPHSSTLDALVSVLGYRSWHDFKLRESIPAKPVTSSAGRRPFHRWMIWPILVALVIGFWLISFRTAQRHETRPVIKGPVAFSGNKTVSQGVPNTVIFKYDVSNVEADSFFFQQSWNDREKVQLDPNGQHYSTIYFYPGFHKAKLIADDSIISRFRVHVTTDGWMPLVRYSYTDNNPIYIKKNPFADGRLHITRDDVAAAGASVDKQFVLSYYNVREFINTESDNFSLDMALASDKLSTVPCPGFEIVVMCEVHIFYVRMMGVGCERDIGIKMGEIVQDGLVNDLSAFGRDMHQMQNVSIKVKDKTATIFLDGKPVHTVTFKQDFGKVVGLTANFMGTGSIDRVALTNGAGTIVYEESF